MAKKVTDELTEAGSTVHGSVKVTKVWTDPTKTQFRDDLAKSLAPLARSQPPTGAAQDQGLSRSATHTAWRRPWARGWLGHSMCSMSRPSDCIRATPTG